MTTTQIESRAFSDAFQATLRIFEALPYETVVRVEHYDPATGRSEHLITRYRRETKAA